MKPLFLLAAGLLLATASHAQTRPQPELPTTRQAQEERLAPAPEKTEAAKSLRVTLNGPASTPKPLYVVDGQPITEEQMKALDPSQIERIDILKQTKGTALHDPINANGVVLITMKK